MPINHQTLKAGAVILNSENRKKIALLYRGKEEDWSFPKGHIETNENPIEAMMREVWEETGLVVSIIEMLPDIEYLNSQGDAIIVKMFLVQSEDDSQLKNEFEKDSIQWIDYRMVIEKLSHDNLKNYFKTIIQNVERATHSN
jgi:8-oxo-dGTP pyrophosphatase MutT (NUDIX family)